MKKINVALYLYPDLSKAAKLKCKIKDISFNNYVADLIECDMAKEPLLKAEVDEHLQDSMSYALR